MTPVLCRDAALRRLWLSDGISVFGSAFTAVAVMAATYEQFRSASMVALVGVAGSLPALLLNSALGRAIDIGNARRVLVGSDLARALLVCGLAYREGYVALYIVCSAVVGVLSLAFRVARTVYIPSVVLERELAAANSGFGITWGLGSALGAVFGGAVVAWAGDRGAFVVDALTFAVSGLLVARLAPPRTPPVLRSTALPGERSTWVQTVRFVWRQRLIRAVVLAGISWGIVGGSFSVLIPVYGAAFAAHGLGIGLFYGVQATGFLIGSLSVGLSGDRTAGQMCAAFRFAYVAQALAFSAFAGHWGDSLVLAALFLARVFGGVIAPLDSSLVQLRVPSDMLARVSALHYAVFGTVMQLSMALTGVLVDVFSAEVVGLTAAAWGVASAAYVWRALPGAPAG